MRPLLRLIVVSIFALAQVSGHKSYQQDIPNGDKVTRFGIQWSAVGHVTGSGPGSETPGLNPFGQDFEKHNHFWTRELCELDSDGDGQTNGFELGDPNCEWSKESVPNRTTLISHPGYEDSMTTWVPGGVEETSQDAGGALSGATPPTPAAREDDNDARTSAGSGRMTGHNDNDDDVAPEGSTGSGQGRRGRGRGSRGEGNTGGDTGNRSPTPNPPRSTPQPPAATRSTLAPGATFSKKFFQVTMTFAKSVEEIRGDQADILARVALILNVQTDQISILSIVDGSAIVTFKLETDESEYVNAESVKKTILDSNALGAYGLQSDTLEATEASPPEEQMDTPQGAPATNEENNVVVIAVVISLVVLVAGVAVVVVCVLMKGRSEKSKGKKNKKRPNQAETHPQRIYETEEGEGFDELQAKPQMPQPGYSDRQYAQAHSQQQQPQAYPHPQQQYQQTGLQFPVHASPQAQSFQNPSSINSSSYQSSANGYPLHQQQNIQPPQHSQYSPRDAH